MLRGVAGGSAVAVGLPLLEAMLDVHGEALAGGERLPRYCITWMAANGFLLSRLEPDGVGADWALKEQMQPLQPYKDYINLCTGFECRGQVDEFIYGHYEGITAYNGYPMEVGLGYDAGGPTIDQVVADVIAEDVGTPVRSIEVGISKAQFLEASGSLGNAFSFRGTPGALVSLPPQFDPREVWQTLFGFLAPGDVADDRALRGSVLDVVKGQADRLRPRLGVRDRQRIDDHMQAVRELEEKIAATPPPCMPPEEPTEANALPIGMEPITDVTLLMAELIAYALQCDITRVASVQLLGLAGETPWTEAGLSAPAHTSSHDAQIVPDALQYYDAGTIYQFERLADFVGVLAGTDDLLGNNLLDAAMVLAASDCSIGWSHSLSRMPMIVIGGGGGHLKYPGVHVSAVENDPDDPDGYDTAYMPTARNTSDVLLSILRGFDPDAGSVGGGQAESSTPVSEILA